MAFEIPDRQSSALVRAEFAAVLVAALLYWTDLLRIVFSGGDGASIEFRLIHFAFYGLFAALLWRQRAQVAAMLATAPILVAFLLLPTVSSLWSIAPADTFNRGTALLGSSLIGVYLATEVRPRAALYLVVITAAVAAAISFFLILFVPSVGLMNTVEVEYVGTWSGAWAHKNAMGQMATLGALACLIYIVGYGAIRDPIAIAGLFLNLALLAGSRSLTSQIVLLVAIVLWLTVGRAVQFIARYALAVVITVALVLVALVAALTADDLLGLLSLAGKDASMSSRVPLWQLLLTFMDGHWWLGFGYEAFWLDGNYAVRVVEEKLHFRPFYAHNGYIELLLGLGLVGLAMMTGLFLRFGFETARRLYRDGGDPLAQFAFVYALIFLLQNASEVTILVRNQLAWSLFVLLYLAMRRSQPDAGNDRVTRSRIAVETDAPRRLPVV